MATHHSKMTTKVMRALPGVETRRDVNCPPGMVGPDCSYKLCPDDCSDRGMCRDGVCICYSGYTGVNCADDQEAQFESNEVMMAEDVSKMMMRMPAPSAPARAARAILDKAAPRGAAGVGGASAAMPVFMQEEAHAHALDNAGRGGGRRDADRRGAPSRRWRGGR